MKRSTRKTGAIAQAKVIACLLDGATFEECAEFSGLRLQTVRDYINALRDENVCHITAWQENAAGRVTIAVYKIGAGTDAKRVAKTRSQMQQKYRLRKREATLLGLLA